MTDEGVPIIVQPNPENPPPPGQPDGIDHEDPPAIPANPTWQDFATAREDQRWQIFGLIRMAEAAKAKEREDAVDAKAKEREDAAEERYRLSEERNAALANRVVQLETAVIEKEKEESAKVTASKVLLSLAEEFPEWIRKDVFDKTRGFPTSKNPSPKMLIPLELENSWLEEPPLSGTDTHGFFPADTKFPTTEKHLVPKDTAGADAGSPKNWPNAVPFEFADPNTQKFLSANSLVQSSKFQLPPEIFEPSAITVNPADEFHTIDALARKTVTEFAVVDQLVGQCKARIIQKVLEMEDKELTPQEVKKEFTLYSHMLEIGHAANLKGRLTATALLVSNKRQARKHVLDRCFGQSYTKQIMKNTSFATPDLFGPPPESLLHRLHGALGNKSLSFTLKPQPLRSNTSFHRNRGPRGIKRRTPFNFHTSNQRPKRAYVQKSHPMTSTPSTSQKFFQTQGSNRGRNNHNNYNNRRARGGKRGRY